MFQSFNTTGIGSLPHTDPVEACKIILDSVDIPFWPQLPHRSFLESMVPMYSEGFPFIRIEGDHVLIVPGEEGAVFIVRCKQIAQGKGVIRPGLDELRSLDFPLIPMWHVGPVRADENVLTTDDDQKQPDRDDP